MGAPGQNALRGCVMICAQLRTYTPRAGDTWEGTKCGKDDWERCGPIGGAGRAWEALRNKHGRPFAMRRKKARRQTRGARARKRIFARRGAFLCCVSPSAAVVQGNRMI
jgi:hypothetical protein